MLQEKQNNNVIALVGGGTGGHVFPLVAVAEELAQQKREFIFIGSAESLEKRVVTNLGWKLETIQAGKWRRYSTFKSLVSNIVDAVKVVIGFFQSIKVIRRNKVGTVFSKGGYVALPVVFAAKLLGCRIIVHESDAVMGMTNRLSAAVADRVLTAFGLESYPNRNDRYRQVGIPVRAVLRRAATLKAPKKSRPLLLVLPGSQGSAAINSFIRSSLPKLLETLDVVHLTGEREYQEFIKIKDSLNTSQRSHYKPYSFIDRELPLYFQSADLVVARSSATTIAEAALFAKAMYLVPLPTAAANHQYENALRLDSANAAIVRQEYQLSTEVFVQDILKLISNPEKLQEIGNRLKEYFKTHATISEIIKEIDGKN